MLKTIKKVRIFLSSFVFTSSIFTLVFAFAFSLSIISVLQIIFIEDIYAADILTLYQEALCKDSTLQAAKEQQLTIRENLPQAKALFLPTLDGQIYYATTHATKARLRGLEVANFNTEKYTLNINQPILHFDHWKKYEQASDQVKEANAQYSAALQDLIIRLSTAYFGVLKAEDNVKFANQSVQAYAAFLKQTEEKFNAGLIAITDVEIAKAQHDNAVSQKIAAANQLVKQQGELQVIIGQPVTTLAFLKAHLEFTSPIPENVEAWIAKAFEQNFHLQAARFGALAAKAEININRYKHLPSVDAVGIIFRSQPVPTLPGPRVTESTAGIRIAIPIYHGGNITSKTRQAIHHYLKTDRELETLYRTVEANTRTAFNSVVTQMNQIQALKNALVSNQNALKATHDAFSVGSRTIVDVLNAQSNLIRAEQNYVEARYNYILQSLVLKEAAGSLCDEDIVQINCWLEEEKG